MQLLLLHKELTKKEKVTTQQQKSQMAVWRGGAGWWGDKVWQAGLAALGCLPEGDLRGTWELSGATVGQGKAGKATPTRLVDRGFGGVGIFLRCGRQHRLCDNMFVEL